LPRDRLRIVVAGMVAGTPRHGGATWAVLQWVLGLRQLGHDVLLLEQVDSLGGAITSYFDDVVRAAGLGGQAALWSREGAFGMPERAVRCFAGGADAVINLAGTLRDPDLLSGAAVLAYVDLDPAFTQVWHDLGIDVGLAGHTHHLSVGLSIGSPGCPIPTCGRDWFGVVPPVVLEHWPVAERLDHDAFTTVASWRGYGSVEHDGVTYGQKAHSWRALLDVPHRAARPCEPAIAIHVDEHHDLAALANHGWHLSDPADVAGSTDDYRRFVQGSYAELGVAKSGYVTSRSGWFSDRSACYLASGRPVVAQDTGFSDHLPTGAGLLAFSTPGEAIAATHDIDADYERHRRAARELAEAHLDSQTVLKNVVDHLGAPKP